MDTSEHSQNHWQQAGRLLGKDHVPYKKISAETWMYIIEDLYGDYRMLYARDLFHPIGAFVSKALLRVSNFVSDCIPHDRITFEKGIGVNTVVYLSPVSSLSDSVQEQREIGLEENLLLLKPEKERPLRFALWRTRMHMHLERSPITKTFLDSTVRELTCEEVLQLFRVNSTPAFMLVNVGSSLRYLAEELQKQAHMLSLHAERVLALECRINHS